MPEGKVIYETKEFKPTNSKDSSATPGKRLFFGLPIVMDRMRGWY
jgi:hypothetical protein